MNNFLDLITKFFDQSFASRWSGNCGGWTKSLVITHVIADLLIWASYMTIPVLLIRLSIKRNDLPFNIFFILFAIFIVGCGFTHLVGAVTAFYPYYYIDFWVKSVTAFASIWTAILLYKMYPQMVSIPNPFTALGTIEKKNKELMLANKINKQLEDFALVAAHDLQDPMKQNNVFLRMIKEGKHEFIDEMEKNNIRMNEFIKNLLTFARSGGVNIKIEPVDLNHIANNVLHDLQEIIGSTKLLIESLPTINCDAIQIQRVFQNLIKNALKCKSPNRPLQIEIKSKKISGYWEFCVIDNGIGITKEILSSLFTIYRGKKTDSTGAGFGLAICKRIVNSHNGTISASSEIGVGTCFTFTIEN